MEKNAIKHFRNTCVKAYDMLSVRFDLDMATEVSNIVTPELKHLVDLAKAWEAEKSKKNEPKVSIRSLLGIKKVGKTSKSRMVKDKKYIQTKIPKFFKKNQKRPLPEPEVGEAIAVEPKKPRGDVFEADSEFSEELCLNSDDQPTHDGPQSGALALVEDQSEEAESNEVASSDEADSDEDSDASDGEDTNDSLPAEGRVMVEVLDHSKMQQHFIDFFDSEVGGAVLDAVSN